MPRKLNSPRSPSLVAIPLLILALVVGVAPPRPALARAQTLPIPGNRATLPSGARVLGALPDDWPMRLVVGLAPRHADLLATFLVRRRHTGSPGAGQALTPAQFAALFTPSAAAQATVVAYLRTRGLRVVRTYPDRLLIDVAGRAARVAGAFDVSLVRYRDRHGHVHFANARPPRLPAEVAALVSTVVGLRDDAAPHHAPAPRTPLTPRPRIPSAPPPGMLAPTQIQTAYDITPIYNQIFSATGGVSVTASITGAGQTVAIYELSPYNPADIAAYDAAFGITAVAPVSIAVDGGATDPYGGTGTQEAALDIELVQAIAPGAQILVYSGPGSLSSTDNTGADDTYARIVNDNRAAVLSTSWGLCEPDQQADTPPDMTLLHTLFAQAVAEGMTVVAPSGDSGANDCVDGKPNPSVDYPASDPYVLGVGGTTLSTDEAGHALDETGWASSGGGPSAVWARPAWQSGPGVPAGAMREVPDVALDAGQRYAVWVSGGWTGVGGTSAGPPVWAALLALANQSRYVASQAQGCPSPPPGAILPGLGDVHGDLYQWGASPGATPALRDITSGPSNGVATPGPGWDAVTGWGVPDAYTLLRTLIAQHALPATCPVFALAPTATPTTTATTTGTASSTASPGPTATATGPGQTPSVSATPTVRSTTGTSGSHRATATPTAACLATPTRTATVVPRHSQPTPTTLAVTVRASRARATPTARAASTAVASSVCGAAGVRPILRRGPSLGVYAVPGHVWVGGVVTLEVRGATGRGQRVVFEVRYPGQKARRVSGATDAHGAVTVRMRVPGELSHNRSALVQVRVTVTVGRHTSVRWVSFRIVPALAARGRATHGTTPPTGRCGSKGQARGERGQARCLS